MTLSKKQKNERDIASRTALSSRNIVEHSMSECAKVVKRNRSLNVTTLKTRPHLLGTVVYVAPKPRN